MTQMEPLEIKGRVSKMRNSPHWISSSFDSTEKKISDLKTEQLKYLKGITQENG